MNKNWPQVLTAICGDLYVNPLDADAMSERQPIHNSDAYRWDEVSDLLSVGWTGLMQCRGI